MKTELPVLPGVAPKFTPKVDYELLLDCVHCGLCTAACPTYVETGNEASSPRGRIYLMRQVIDGVLELDATVEKHIDQCLNCRACETACPSGVQYGRLIEPFREAMEHAKPGRTVAPLNWLQRQLLFHVFPSRVRTRLALAPARFLQWSGLDSLIEKSGLMRLAPKSLRTMKNMLPDLHAHYGSLPDVLPAIGPKRARVGLFLGCVADAIYPQTNYATAKVLQANGCEVVIVRGQQCCGALHYHSGAEDEARSLAVANCDAFLPQKLDAIITNAAGCGAMLKDYAHMMLEHPRADDAATFQHLVKDVHEFLDALGPIKPTHPVKLKAAYHDACHLRHAQQIQKAPRNLLSLIPGLELVPLGESELCCGAAGSYNLTQPDMAERLGDRKIERIRETGAAAVFMGNVGCLMQVAKHLKQADAGVWAAHPMDVLWASYSGEMPPELK